MDELNENRYFGSKISLDNLQISRAHEADKKVDCISNYEFFQTWKQYSSSIQNLWNNFRNVSEFVLFAIFRLTRLSNYILSMLITAKIYASQYINVCVKRLVAQLLGWVLSEQNLMYIIRALDTTIIGIQCAPPSEQVFLLYLVEKQYDLLQETRLRAELAQRRLDDYIEEKLSPYLINLLIDSRRCRLFIQEFHGVLQYPRLNKQLALVLLDVLVEKFRHSIIVHRREF